ncbi:hypothetical protein AMJ96_PD00429 (plasmid) [Rhizobium sp. N113]|nr:hypothetical protein AMJ96_PD00429 [Rhizobium sp. N113]
MKDSRRLVVARCVRTLRRRSMHEINPAMQECIENCLRCCGVCLRTAMNHCLEAGGKHTEPRISGR